MRWSDLPLDPTSRMLRQFAAAWLILFLALSWRQGWAAHHPLEGWLFGGVALLGLVGLLTPPAVRWLFVATTVAAFPIGWLVTQAVLLAMFYLVLTPMAWGFRRMGRDALQLRRRRAAASYWTARGDPPEAGRYLKQF